MFPRFKARNHPQQKHNPEGDDRATNPALFAALHDEFNFTLDACATAQNAKLPRFVTPEQDGLKADWTLERVYCNPPFSNIRPWIEKAHRSNSPLIVLLLPNNRCEQPWWQELVEPHRDRSGWLSVRFLPGRTRFIPSQPYANRKGRPPFGCLLLIYRQ